MGPLCFVALQNATVFATAKPRKRLLVSSSSPRLTQKSPCEGCEGVTAEYSKRPDGLIRVLNTCRQDAVDGPVRTAEAKAKVVDTVTNAKLKVSFFGPFFGDYWIMDHADDYSWAIVGEGSGRYLWLLSRQPPSDADRTALTARAKALGYDVGMLRPTKQPPR